MLFTQNMKMVEIKSFQELLSKNIKTENQLLKFCQNLKVEIDIPGVDIKELSISFAENTLKLGSKESIEDNFQQQYSGYVVANNANTKVARGLMERMAKTEDAVLIYGENGTGKGLFARTIHQQSARRGQPFVSISCSAIDKVNAKQQIEDSLVDVVNGTLLLDGVQDLDIETQRLLKQMLRLPVEQKPFRLISTTSGDLNGLVRKGAFSAELLALLQGCYIELLPLQQRKEDIEALVTFYMEESCKRCGIEPKNLSPELLNMLESYPWPGNVLELVNTIEQLMITAQEKRTLFAKDLPTHIRIQTINSSAAQKKGL